MQRARDHDPWIGVAAQISEAIGQAVPEPESPDFEAFLVKLKETHPVYAEMLEEVRPGRHQVQENEPREEYSLTTKARVRQLKQSVSERLWWRPSSLGKLVLNKRRGGIVVVSAVLVIFGGYTLSYFTQPAAKTGGLTDGTPLARNGNSNVSDANVAHQPLESEVNTAAVGSEESNHKAAKGSVEGKTADQLPIQSKVKKTDSPFTPSVEAPPSAPPAFTNSGPMSVLSSEVQPIPPYEDPFFTSCS